MKKLGVIWNAFRKVGSELIERVMGPSFARDEAVKVTAAAKTAITPKITNYDDAYKASRNLGELGELGLVEPAEFAKTAKAVFDSPQSGNFASEITRHTATALKDIPNSVELLSALAKGHQQLDKNISERMQRAVHVKDPAELRAIHTNNIRDARAIVDTGAPAELRDDAFKDIAKTLNHLMAYDTAAARRISAELAKDPAMREGVGSAARALRASETAKVQPAAPVARPQVSDMDRVWANERLRRLGVFPPQSHAEPPAMLSPSTRLPETPLADKAVAPAKGASANATTAWESIARPRQLSAVEDPAVRMAGASSGHPVPHVSGIEVHDLDMSVDAFKALLAEPVKSGKPAAAATTARPTTLSH